MAAGARKLTLEETLPQSGDQGLLVGRAWLPGERGGPTVVLVRGGRLFDVSAAAPTISALLEVDDLPAALRTAHGRDLGPLEEWLQSTSDHGPDPARRHLLAPNDLQVVKAAGVTFVEKPEGVHTDARGALTQPLLGELVFELVHDPRGDAAAAV